jgi:hypothetical protein
MKKLALIFVCLTLPIMAFCSEVIEQPKPPWEVRAVLWAQGSWPYLDLLEHWLYEAEGNLCKSNLSAARVCYEFAKEWIAPVSDANFDQLLRLKLGLMIVVMLTNKDRDGIELFVKNIVKSAKYKNGKLLIEIENFEF